MLTGSHNFKSFYRQIEFVLLARAHIRKVAYSPKANMMALKVGPV